MFRNKIIKWRKLIVMVIVGFLTLNFLLPFFHKAQVQSPHVNKVETRTIVKRAEVIDEKLVVKALINVHQIVGLEGHSQKTYTYSDSWFQSHKAFLNWIGERSYSLDAEVKLKMGVDFNIKQNDVVVSDKKLIIFLPKPVLISLEVPYNKIKVTEESGVLRFNLKENEKQFLYGEMLKTIESEIKSDQVISNKATKGVQDALRGFLEKIPNVEEIVFITRP